MFYGKEKSENGYKKFLTDLKNSSLGDILLFYGEEQFLVEWAEQQVVSKYVSPAMLSMDKQVIYEDSGVSDIIGSMKTYSMLSEKRVVIIKDPSLLSSAKPKCSSEEADELINELKSGNDACVVIFESDSVDGRNKLVKELKKAGGSYDFGSLDRHELEAFAAKRIHENGSKIGRQEMDYLIRETGYENRESDYKLYNFDNDLKKLSAYAAGSQITNEMIEETISGDSESFIFDLIDGISGNDKTRAFEMINTRLSKDQYEAMSLTGAIASQIEIMLEVKELNEREGLDARSISKRTGINEFRAKKALGYARRYNLEKLRNMLSGIYDVNRNIVKGLMEPRMALEMFIAEI